MFNNRSDKYEKYDVPYYIKQQPLKKQLSLLKLELAEVNKQLGIVEQKIKNPLSKYVNKYFRYTFADGEYFYFRVFGVYGRGFRTSGSPLIFLSPSNKHKHTHYYSDRSYDDKITVKMVRSSSEVSKKYYDSVMENVLKPYLSLDE
jgi:hypothetical protein